MNKIPLLEKFAAQSLVYVDTGLSDGKELVFSKEKFAELIVRECADIAREIGNNTEPDDFALDRCYEIEDQIMKHFGVEK